MVQISGIINDKQSFNSVHNDFTNLFLCKGGKIALVILVSLKIVNSYLIFFPLTRYVTCL